MTNSKNRRLLLISLVTLSVFTSDLYLSSLPELVSAFSSYPERIQLTLSVYFIGFSLSMLFCGPLSDRFGRKKILSFGLGLYLFATLLCLLTSNLTVLIVGRAMQSFGGCCGSILSRIIGRDLYSKENDAMTLSRLYSGMFVAMALACLAAPLLGSVLLPLFGWRANFAFLFILGGAFFCLAIRLIQETHPEEKREKISLYHHASKYIEVLKNSQFLLYNAIITSIWTGFFAFESAAPFVCMNLFKSSSYQFGSYFAIAMSGFILGSFFSRYLTEKVASTHLIFFGLMLIFTSGVSQILSCSLEGGLLGFISSMFFYLFGLGLVLSHCQVFAIEPFKQSVSHAFSLLYFSKMMCGSLGGWLVVYFMKGSYLPLAIVIFVSGSLGLAIKTRDCVLNPRTI